MKKNKTPESLPDQTHPYSVRMSVLLGSNIELVMDEDTHLIEVQKPNILRITKDKSSPRDEANFYTNFRLDLEAFTSACEAERFGRLLTISLLWIAAFKRVTIGFKKRTGDYPFAIRDRTLSSGISAEGEGRGYIKVKPEEVGLITKQIFEADIDVTQSVLISMEFYAAARLESTVRARFISLMTALEALAEQQYLGDDIKKILSDLASKLEEIQLLSTKEKRSLKDSLKGRITRLSKESVRQAIQRTIKDHLDEKDTLKFVDEIYGVRSKMLHEGHLAADLPNLCNRLESILARTYSSILGLPLPDLK